MERRTGEFLSRLREYSFEEIRARNAAGECLLVVDGMVLDVTRWLPEHPGGATIIPGQALNIDSATMFEVYHASREVRRQRQLGAAAAPNCARIRRLRLLAFGRSIDS